MQDKPRQWCPNGHNMRLHPVINAEDKTSSWWWICSQCGAFESAEEREIKAAMNGSGVRRGGD